MAINAGSVMQNSYSLVYNILTNKLADQHSPTRTGSTFIFSAWPNKQDYPSNTWVDYPIVVLTLSSENMNETIGRRKVWTIGLQIDMYGKKMADIDKLTDNVQEIFTAYETNLVGSGLHNFKLLGCPTNDTVIENATVHQRVLNYNFDYHEVRS